MDRMPEEIKDLIRKYAAHQLESLRLNEQIEATFRKYGVPYENLTACADNRYDGEPQTEALAYINNAELDDLELSINDIEEVFLYFANRNTNGGA